LNDGLLKKSPLPTTFGDLYTTAEKREFANWAYCFDRVICESFIPVTTPIVVVLFVITLPFNKL